MSPNAIAQSALNTTHIDFTFILPQGWQRDPLQVAFRLRGVLGLSLKKNCCFFDAHATPCQDCPKRDVCHYGQSFETPQAVKIEGVGRVGSMPHAWSLAVDMQGLQVCASVILAGHELAFLKSWKAAITNIPYETHFCTCMHHEPAGSLQWQSITPVRLRHKGKTPTTEADVASALVSSVVQRCQALAALHQQQIPTAQLQPPVCSDLIWQEATRLSLRHKQTQKLGGWMMRIDWGEVDEAWLPWLQLTYALGLGRQTSFGLGRLQPL